MSGPHHFIVEGPCRDYDISLFCEAHYHEAVEFASGWLAEVVDNADVGESVSVKVTIKKGLIDSEEDCQACPRECSATKPAPTSPRGMVASGPRAVRGIGAGLDASAGTAT